MVTMQDVADRAGVSLTTVSFVVNDTKPVAPRTRAKVEAAMAELGYRRNVLARALASRRTRPRTRRGQGRPRLRRRRGRWWFVAR